MIPGVLSTDLASLRGQSDRLCVSVLWEFDTNWNIVRTWMGRTAIYNRFDLSYAMAQHIVDCSTTGNGKQKPFTGVVLENKRVPDPAEAESLLPGLKLLLHGARSLRAARAAAGALELESLKVEFELDAKHRPVNIGMIALSVALYMCASDVWTICGFFYSVYCSCR
jgi:exoribonuclease R